METERNENEIKETLDKDLLDISNDQWKDMGWPLISMIPHSLYHTYQESEDDTDKKVAFWAQVFNPENYYTPEFKEQNLDNKLAFIIQDQGGFNFKAITTRIDLLVEDPVNMLNYNHHGKPCENRGGGSYPTCNFWDIYDLLSLEEQGSRPIPDRNWREIFVTKNFKKKNV